MTVKRLRLSIWVVTLALLVGGFVVIGYYGRPVYQMKNSNAAVSAANAESPNASGNSETYTLADIEQHRSPDSCWTAINGGVYDLTQWIPRHPGGSQAIIDICGIDATRQFERQHGHSHMVAKMLALFKIGDLSS